MTEELSERGKQILETIIEEYIQTAEPIGSRSISRSHPLALSPATIRNVMADLEEMGFLASPHTSAGRVPTDKAYRFYVDSLLQVHDASGSVKEAIQRRIELGNRDVADLLRQASRVLSSLSHYMGIVVAPRMTSTFFRQIDFIRLGGRRVLAILVAQNGLIQNRLFEIDEEISPADLVRMGNYLNSLLQGVAISEVRSRIIEEMRNEKVLYDSLLAQALDMSEKTLQGLESELFIEGQVNILDQPEFADVGKMRDVFHAFEEKGQLLRLFDRCMEADGVRIFIGRETCCSQMEEMSLVTSTYATGINTVGAIGVIGPTRMGYGQVIPIVDYTAKLLSRLLDNE
jgi:heat-inducible transcriptional repressor